MGAFRLFLAVSIVIAHAGAFLGARLADARLAVQMFYLISGFAMAFVWHGKYATSRQPIRTFFVGRALRIYPQYFIVLILSVLVSLYGWQAEHRHPIATAIQAPIHGWGGVWLYVQQVTLIGMDTHLFMQRAADGTLQFCADFHHGTLPPLHYYMFVSPAWMLSLQLVFYLLVPMLLPRPKLWVAALILSFLARGVGWWFGLRSDPWTHRFLPFEVGVFLLGVISYHAYAWIKERRPEWLARPWLGWTALGALTVEMLCLPLLQKGMGEGAFWLCYLTAMAVFPFAFHASMRSMADRWVGELAYPMYISHLLMMSIGEFFLGIPLSRLVYFAIPATLVVSVLLDRAQRRIDAFRHSLVKAKTLASS